MHCPGIANSPACQLQRLLKAGERKDKDLIFLKAFLLAVSANLIAFHLDVKTSTFLLTFRIVIHAQSDFVHRKSCPCTEGQQHAGLSVSSLGSRAGRSAEWASPHA